MAVGIGLGFLDVNIVVVVGAAIGVTTFVAVTAGVMLGRVLGQAVGKRAELLGSRPGGNRRLHPLRTPERRLKKRAGIALRGAKDPARCFRRHRVAVAKPHQLDNPFRNRTKLSR